MASLYFTKSSCGAATYIAAKAGGVKFAKTVPVDLRAHKLLGTETDYYSVNPKGNVPCIVLEDSTIINENVGTLYYVGKQGNLLGSGSDEFEVVTLLGYLASELHKAHSPIFRAPDNEARQKIIDEDLTAKYEYLKKTYFKKGKFLIGDTFTVADAYLYVMTYWPAFFGLEAPAFGVEIRNRFKDIDFVKEAHAEMEKLEADASK